MSKSEDAKKMAETENSKEYDSVSALIDIAQAGKLNELESLVTQVALLAKELHDEKRGLIKKSLAAYDLGERTTNAITRELRATNKDFCRAIKQVEEVSRQIDYLNNRPAWTVYTRSILFSLFGAAVMAFCMFHMLPDYDTITSNQSSIYHAIKQEKSDQ